jgi:hypothetical protein
VQLNKTIHKSLANLAINFTLLLLVLVWSCDAAFLSEHAAVDKVELRFTNKAHVLARLIWDIISEKAVLNLQASSLRRRRQ